MENTDQSVMDVIDIQYIKTKLAKFGITFENFKHQTGNLVGRVIVPNALRAYNRNLTAEQAFYFVTNKVFESANVIAFGIPVRIQDNYEKIVSHEDYRDFQKAIYEEVNQRFLSNSFPEFQNAGSVSLSNASIQSGYLGGQLISDWVNPLSRQIISNIDWRQYDCAADVERDKVYMYRDGANAWFPTSTDKRVLLALEDGSMGFKQIDDFAKQSDLVKAGETIKQNWDAQTQNRSDINDIKKEMKNLAPFDYVNDVAVAFPKTEVWDPDKTYTKPAFVVHLGKIYWNNIDENLGNVPGGVTGEGKWIEVRDLFVADQVSSIIYDPATDFKYAKANPNSAYYVDIAKILEIGDLDENSLFNYLDHQFPHLNLSKDEVLKFYENLCNCDPNNLIDTYAPKIKYSKDSILTFDDLISMDEFIRLNNLTENDYEFINSTSYLRFANRSSLDKEGGSNFIKQSDLPNILWSWQTIAGWTGSGRYIADVVWKNENVIVDSAWPNGGADGSNGSGKSRKENKISIYLNGNVEQTEFNPKYYSIFAIKFKRNIYYAKQLNIYTNVCKMSLEGKLIKADEDDNRFDDKDYIYVRKTKKAKTGFNTYILESVSGQTFNVPDSVSLQEFLDKLNSYDLANYYDKENVDLLLNGLRLLSAKLDEVNNFEQENHFLKNVYVNEKVLVNSDTAKVIDNDNQLTTKKYVDDQVAAIEYKTGIRFYTGEIRMFDTKVDFEVFNKRFNLVENQDYRVLEADRYLITGASGNSGGSNFIKQTDLPNVSGQFGTGNNSPVFYGNDTSGCFVNSTNKNKWPSPWNSQGSADRVEQIIFNLNPDEQTKFTPQYKRVFTIKFLRDI